MTTALQAPSKKPIGILGGTFDPVHHGHLRTALELQQILDLQQVRFIPCQQPVHKDNSIADASHRLQMLTIATANEPSFVVDDREIQRASPSYMVETLASLRKEFPDTPLVLILGSDAFVNLASWHNWQQLIELAHIAVAIRAGKKMTLDSEMDRFLLAHQDLDYGCFHESLAGKVFLQFVTALDISSTAIRCQLEANYNPRYLLPDSVLDYIHQHHLYR
jgi:nicotinate-nucleotide adenylyltransferase